MKPTSPESKAPQRTGITQTDKFDPEYLRELKAQAVEIVGRLAIPHRAGKRALTLIEDMAKTCNKANPTVTVEAFKQELLKLNKGRRWIALRLLADRNLGASNDIIAVILRINRKQLLTWCQEPTFAYLLRTLTTGYNKSLLEPKLFDVVLGGLDRKYVANLHDKETGELLHSKGEPIYDAVTVGFLREGKSMAGMATEVSAEAAPPITPEEEQRQKREMAKFLRDHPEVRRVVNKAHEVEEHLPEDLAVDAAGELKVGEDA